MAKTFSLNIDETGAGSIVTVHIEPMRLELPRGIYLDSVDPRVVVTFRKELDKAMEEAFSSAMAKIIAGDFDEL